MAWLWLTTAGALEVGWATCLKLSDGFSRPLPSIGFAVMTLGSMLLLGLALKTLPIGTAYAVWVGIGAAGTALVGMAAFGDPATLVRLLLVTALIGSIVGLKLTA